MNPAHTSAVADAHRLNAQIVGLGTVVVDHLVVLPEHPRVDTKTTVLEDRFQVGGPVPTALVLLQRLGWRCSFIGSWADDPLGLLIDDDLTQQQLDLTHAIIRPRGRTGFAHVWVDQATGSRTIACCRPAQPISPDELDEAPLSRARALHLDGWPGETAIKAARIVQQNQGIVCIDTGSPKPGMDKLIPHVDVLNCPRRFLMQFLETDDLNVGIRQLLAMGPHTVTVTDGPRGSVIGTADGIIQCRAFPVDAVDTTGAGDIFCGALIHGILRNWPPHRLLEFASAAAAIKCQTLGNRCRLSSPEQIDAWIALHHPAALTPAE